MNTPHRTKLSLPRTVPCMVCATTLVVLYVLSRTAGAAPNATLGDSAAAFAQDKPPTKLEPMNDSQRELVELFSKVEVRLREIDRLLSDAGAGDTSALDKVGPSGIDELLKRSKEQGESAVKDIDRILEIAQSMQQSSSQGQGQPRPGQGQGQGQQQQQSEGQQGQSPLDNQGSTTTQREQTPSGPEQQGGQQPKDKDGQGGTKPKGQDGKGDSKQDGDKPKGDGTPKDPSASKSDPKNQASAPPAGSGRGAASSSADGKDRWGDLPVHARDVFRNEGGRDMPVQYRDWIDAYYRRLNKKGP